MVGGLCHVIPEEVEFLILIEISIFSSTYL